MSRPATADAYASEPDTLRVRVTNQTFVLILGAAPSGVKRGRKGRAPALIDWRALPSARLARARCDLPRRVCGIGRPQLVVKL